MVLIESRFKAWPGELSSEAIAHWKRAVKSAWVAAARSIVGWPMMRPGVLAVSSLRPRRQASVTLRRGSQAAVEALGQRFFRSGRGPGIGAGMVVGDIDAGHQADSQGWDGKSTRLNSSHKCESRMPSSS